jgi:hypothetical protein
MRTIVLLGLTLVTGCGPGAAENRKIYVSEEIAADFAAHPERYAGKTLVTKVWHLNSIPQMSRAGFRAPPSPKEFAGKPGEFVIAGVKAEVRFVAILPGDPRKLPEGLNQGGGAVITFLCRDGKLDTGNHILEMLAD